MKISQLNDAQFSQQYGIFCAATPTLGDRDGIYSTFCRIVPGSSTLAHTHFEPEIYYIIRGAGLIKIDDKVEKIYEGNLIRIPSLAKHELKNTGPEDLIFLSVYSEDIETPFLPNSVVITSAPPTPNGPLHFGHISGPYLVSDILARYLRLRSTHVWSHCGTDDHQNFIYEKAHILQIPAENFRSQMRMRIQKGLASMRIDYDEFIEPKADKAYKDKILDFVQRAIDSKVIHKETVELPYCTQCELTLVDSLINGLCPYCKTESCGACENCGVVVPPQSLLNAICSRCKNQANIRLVTVYLFDLSKYLPVILNELSQRSLSPRLQELVEGVSQMKNLKVLLTHPAANVQGIYLPELDQVLHVWFEMAAHYEQFALNPKFWIHTFGFDNGFYYLLFIPSLLRAMNPRAKLPDAIITNDFLQLEGHKFSTSRKHAIWADEFLGNIDHLRLYLSLNRGMTIIGTKRYSKQ